MMYSVKIKHEDGFSYLSHRNRTAWSRPAAIKFAREYVAAHGGSVVIEQAEQLSNGDWY